MVRRGLLACRVPLEKSVRPEPLDLPVHKVSAAPRALRASAAYRENKVPKGPLDHRVNADLQDRAEWLAKPVQPGLTVPTEAKDQSDRQVPRDHKVPLVPLAPKASRVSEVLRGRLA